MTTSPRPLQSALAALHQMHTVELGATLKAMESLADPPAAPPGQPFIVRIDGVAFSTFTSGIAKPFDARLKNAMVDTTKDLVAKFNPLLAFHHSDEISLVYPAAVPSPLDPYASDPSDSTPQPSKKRKSAEKTHMYSGRIQKLASVVSSYASARLNFHLSRCDWSDRPANVQQRMKAHEAYFDGRVVSLPDLKTATDCIYWRSNFDGFRNSVSGIAQHHFKHSELHGKNLTQLLDLLATKKIDVLETYGPKYLFGTWIKKETYTVSHEDLNLSEEAMKHIKKDVAVVRKRVRTGCFDWSEYTEDERIRFLAAKFWPEGEGAPPKEPLENDKEAGAVETFCQ
ncbi:hypothetical protein HDU98_008873 [Podochytrium sp. JEL0797]|nr:hypothetical protein HDU98_008873 [Podochytrium sp. JEL0797]